MRRLWIAPLLSMALGYAPVVRADPPVENAVVIERVVAVVGHRAIFLSELRERAKPFLKQIDVAIPDDKAKHTAAQEQVKRDLLERMIEEMLIARAAEKARLAVSTDDIDRALASVATSQKLTVPQLLKAASEQGLDEQRYRDELRRQILEGKVLARLVRMASGPTQMSGSAQTEAMVKEREKLLADLRRRTFVEKRL